MADQRGIFRYGGDSQDIPRGNLDKIRYIYGYKIAGIFGVIAANIGNMLAPVLIIICAALFYNTHKESPMLKGAFDAIRPAVFAMIIAVAFQAIDIRNLTEAKSLLIIILSFVIFIYTKVHPAVVILACGAIGAIWR